MIVHQRTDKYSNMSDESLDFREVNYNIDYNNAFLELINIVFARFLNTNPQPFEGKGQARQKKLSYDSRVMKPLVKFLHLY